MSAETELSEVANQIADGRRILRELIAAGRDTPDEVCARARAALTDAEDHVEDVIEAILDGRITEVPGGEA